MSGDKKFTSVHYHSYLKLDEILNAQAPISTAMGDHAHEEMLFIIVHQVYELWFKQINYEIRSVMNMFDEDMVDEKSIIMTVGRLERVIEIQKVLIEQIGIMETMTPLDFLDFRNYLFPASGFQSFQFRTLEVLLGLKKAQRLTFNQVPFDQVFSEEKRKEIDHLERGPNLLELIEDWLERTPFLEFKDFNFLEEYKLAVDRMLDKEKTAILNTDFLSEKYKSQRLKMLGDTDSYFSNVLNPEVHQKAIDEGRAKLSYRATVAALLINLYREEPILQMAYQLLSKLVDIDELLTSWRYRHAQMVLRMLGKKIGTGGSSGHEYLQATALKHHVFMDLHNISTLLIPRSELPILPVELKQQLGFYFTSKVN
jgi:tryptophan 2,3-dioxygenase